MDADRFRWQMGQVEVESEWSANVLRSFVRRIYHVIELMIENMRQSRNAGWRGIGTFDVKLIEESELQALEQLITEIELMFHWKCFDFQREE